MIRAAYRSFVTGRPAKIEVALEAGDLLEENEKSSFTTDGYVMYDMVKLEVL